VATFPQPPVIYNGGMLNKNDPREYELGILEPIFSPRGPSMATGLSEAMNRPFSLNEVPQWRSRSNGSISSTALSTRSTYHSLSATRLYSRKIPPEHLDVAAGSASRDETSRQVASQVAAAAVE